MTFVKSASTSTPVVNSKAEVERILRRYGADGLSVAQDYARGIVTVTFIVPDRPGSETKVPVRLPIEVFRVFQALFPKDNRGRSTSTWTLEMARKDEKAWGQAERVAWRNLVLWIDAALAASASGLQSITEAFFAHALLSGDGRRVIDVAEAGETIFKQLPAGSPSAE